MEKNMSAFQLGSQTPCKHLEADHDDPSTDCFDDSQNMEISVTADGYSGEMKKRETPSKSRRVGRFVLVSIIWLPTDYHYGQPYIPSNSH